MKQVTTHSSAAATGRRSSVNAAARRWQPRRWPSIAVAVAVVGYALLQATTAFAAQVSWEDPGPLAAGQRTTLNLVFEGGEPAARVVLPRVDGLTVLGSPSQGSNISIVNGRTSASFTLSYPIRADKQGDIEIPSFRVATDQGTETVAATTIAVGKAAMPTAGGRGKPAVTAQIVTSNRQPYAGEVFDVDVLVGLNGARRGEIVGKPTSDKQDIIIEPWRDAEEVHGTGSVRLSTRAMAPKAGKTELAPIHQEMNVDLGRPQGDPFAAMRSGRFDPFDSDSFFDSFFARNSMSSVTVSTDSVPLDVQPLPAAPAGFTGAVGQFTLESKIVPAHPKAGDPVTWTLTLTGTGNWSTGVALPAREIPNDFRTLQPKQKRNFEENETFTGSVSEDLVLVPTKPGTFKMPPVRFTYFDPETQSYQTAAVEVPAMEIGGTPINAAAPIAALNTSPATASNRVTTADKNVERSDAAVLATAPTTKTAAVTLPHAPIAGATSTLTPFTAQRMLWIVALPIGFLLTYWLVLAVRHARLTDPQRARREALRALRSAIECARRAETVTDRRDALLAWQHAASVALELETAAPTPAHVRARRAAEVEWSMLWTESDCALYGRNGELDPLWYERAKQAVAGCRRPRFNPLRGLLPSNLIPKAAAAALAGGLILGALPVLAQDAPAALDPIAEHIDAAAAYTQGDFTGARDTWKSDVEADPSNWVARYNLGLAESQLGSNGQALGQTLAAFVHEPSNESVRWNLNAFATRVPGVDRAVQYLVRGEGLAAVAGLIAPAIWQVLLAIGVVTFCFGAAVMLRYRYTGVTCRNRWNGMVPATAGAVVGLLALLSLHTYGDLAAPNAALIADQTVLRSVPTDAQDAQQQKPVQPGTVVAIGKQFLGWTQVALASGETGWLRAGEFVPLYAHPRG